MLPVICETINRIIISLPIHPLLPSWIPFSKSSSGGNYQGNDKEIGDNYFEEIKKKKKGEYKLKVKWNENCIYDMT